MYYIKNVIQFILITFTLCNSISTRKRNDIENLAIDCEIRNSTTLDACLFHVLHKLRPLVNTGIPELGLKQLDPMFIKNISIIHKSNDPTFFNAIFSDLQVYGLSNYTVLYSGSKTSSKILNVVLKLKYPVLDINGFYDISGKILLLPIIGDGPLHVLLYDVIVDANIWVILVENKSKHQLEIKHIDIEFLVNNCSIKLYNLFNGNELLGKSINEFLNNNAQDLIEEFKPVIKEKLKELITNTFIDVVKNIPIDENFDRIF